MTKKKVMVVCGTRPEIIKMAPVYKALQNSDSLEPVLVHTGQHTDLATPLYSFFEMPTAHAIELTRRKPTLAHLSEVLLSRLAEVFEQDRPAAVLVHGDTSSAAMAALAAFYEQIPIGHVEAGLRTYDNYSPFPEEMNRSLIGRMANWHYAPTERAADALRLENVKDDVLLVTGNTVIDAAHLTASMLDSGVEDDFIASQQLQARTQGKRLVLVTAHRRENWGDGLRNIAHAVADLLSQHDDLFVVWPLHANPAVAQTVREVMAERQMNADNLLLCQPLDYAALVWLLHRAWVVMTDSGGIQEESAAFGAPVLVLRDTTERPELIEAGGGVLVGAKREVIVGEFNRLDCDPQALQGMKNIVNPFGDGNASQRIVKHLEQVLA